MFVDIIRVEYKVKNYYSKLNNSFHNKNNQLQLRFVTLSFYYLFEKKNPRIIIDMDFVLDTSCDTKRLYQAKR